MPETLELYGIDGVKIPGICDNNGRELSYLPCRTWQSSGAWVAQLYWWRYQYSGDLEFLREVAYPLMREIAQFYRGFVVADAEGLYHSFPSTSPEQSPWWATDPGVDLALIPLHMRATVEASCLVDCDEELRAGWQDVAEHMARPHHNGEVLLDHRDAAPDCRLAHTGLLCVVFTAGQIGLRSSPEQQALAIRTLHSLLDRSSCKVLDYPWAIPTWNDDCCWPNMVGYAARLGLAEEARAYLYDLGIFQHLKPNGLFAFDCVADQRQREVRWGMPNSNHAMTAVVSEMLI